MQCQICKSKQIERYTRIDNTDIYQCLGCKLAFVDPKTARRKTDTIYSLEDYKKREGQYIKRYTYVVDLVKTYTQGKRILEVGAGFGLLSSMLYRSGFDVEVLEPDVCPYYLRNLSVSIHMNNLKEYAQHTKKLYDVIILYDVLEHIDNPMETVAILQKLLYKKGIVLIQTPNYLSLMARIVKKWSWWMVEDHRYFFSKQSLYLLFCLKRWKSLFYSTYEEWPDVKKNLDGNFMSITWHPMRKFIKIIFFALFIPVYFLGKTYLWKSGKGGLHIAIWQVTL